MAAYVQHLRRSAVPAAAYLLSSSSPPKSVPSSASCEAPAPASVPSVALARAPNPSDKDAAAPRPAGGRAPASAGFVGGSDEEHGTFHGLFPRRQLFQPRVEWPLWDGEWDGRRPPSTGDPDADRRRNRTLRKAGVTRHIILIRHGQYDETHAEDEKRILTPLGREQADATGERIAEMVKGIDEEFGPCKVKVVRVSNLARAKETANLICQHLPDVERADPDPLLNEGRPCHNVPGGKASANTVARTDEDHARIEEAFKKYFHRADPPEADEDKEVAAGKEAPQPQDGDEPVPAGEQKKELQPHPQHEFEIIVCHANVIRYFACRALQIPPEAWLRLCTFNCSLTYFTIRATGSVSCRMLGDIGHLGLSRSTFSMHPGFNW